jgi:hypothetical protein
MKQFSLPSKNGLYDNLRLQDVNNWWVFTGITLIYLFSSYYLQTQVLTDQVYYNSLGSQYTANQVEQLIHARQQMGVLGYLLVPVTLLLKLLFTCFCLYTGLLLTAQQASFRVIFKIVLFAESAFVLATLTRLVLMAFFIDLDTFESIHLFSPLSLLSFFDASRVPAYLVYGLQTINFFEILYILLLAAGLRFFLQRSFKDMMRLVLISYIPALLCWIALMAFITISMSN